MSAFRKRHFGISVTWMLSILTRPDLLEADLWPMWLCAAHLPGSRKQGSCVVVNSSRCHGANVTMRTLTKPASKDGQAAIGGLLTSASNDPRAKPPERLQDVGKGDCSGCSCGFRLRTNAEISVMTSPIGKGSMNVNTALKNGFLYSSLYFRTC